MGTKKKSDKNTMLENDAAIASTSLAVATTHDDDEEANKDLSLEIVQKALLKRATDPKNDAVLDTPTKITASEANSEESKSQNKRKRKKKKKLESAIESVNVSADIVEETEGAVETMKAPQKVEKQAVKAIEAPEKVEPAAAETSLVNMSDGVVLRKMPGQYCHRCKRVGHRAKSCPDKHKGSSKSSTKCLESENSGHMFSCKNGYSHNDLKAVSVEEEALGTIKALEKIEEEAIESMKAPEKVEPAEAETGMVDMSDNAVLRKLLRGPRYFDPPSDSGWATCYNCGEEGHAAVNCTATKRKKPCFVCGSLEHNVKKCPTGHYCRRCNKVGHQAKKCPDKNKGGSKSLSVCLRCGNSGHDMFSCKNGYSQDDLKEIQCYVCKRFGHLCCVNTPDAIPEFSCYKCGQIGHTGLACSRFRAETTDAATPSSCYKCGEGGHFARECLSSVKASSRGKPETNDAATPSSCYKCGEEGHFSRECSSSVKASSRRQIETTGAATPSSCYKCGEEGHFSRECSSSVKASSRRQIETTGAATPSSCYKCGEEGHFSRECSSSVKSGKRKRESSNTKSPRFQKENDYMGYRSAPNDMGDKRFITPQKSMHRDGMMAEHPGDRRFITPPKSMHRDGMMAEHPGDRRFITPPKSMHRDGWMVEHPGDRRYINPQISMHRGGWIGEHPGEFTPSRFVNNNWRSPVIPSTNTHIHFLSNGSQIPSSEHYRAREVHLENTYSGGPARTYNHGYAAPRYGNSGSNGLERNNYRW